MCVCCVEELGGVGVRVRFVFVLLGPRNDHIDYLEIGRCVGTLMTNMQFRECAYEARDRRDMVETIGHFTTRSLCLVLPIGQHDDDLLEPVIEWMRHKLAKKMHHLMNNSLEAHSPTSPGASVAAEENVSMPFGLRLKSWSRKHSRNTNSGNEVSGAESAGLESSPQKTSQAGAGGAKSLFVYSNNNNSTSSSSGSNHSSGGGDVGGGGGGGGGGDGSGGTSKTPFLNNVVNRIGHSGSSFKHKDEVGFNPFQRTGYLFGCLCLEIRNRYAHYRSDFADALNVHCLVAFIFTFTVCVAPALCFGGILADKTSDWFGVNEMLLATSLNGIIVGLFSGQPLMIMGPTGPFLVFEEMLYLVNAYIVNSKSIKYNEKRC